MLAHLKSISNHPFRRDDEKGLGSTKNSAKRIFSYNCQVFVHCALQCAMCSMRPPSFFSITDSLPSFIARVTSFTIGLKANKRQSYKMAELYLWKLFWLQRANQPHVWSSPNAVVISCGSILLSSSAASRLDVEINIYEIYLAHHHLISCN